MPKLRKPRYGLYPKLIVSKYFIPNFKHKNIVYLKLNTPIYYIHTEKYSPKSYVVNFRTQISSSQSEERTMVFTREKNDTSNQKRARCFFACEKNDTSNQKHRGV